MTQLRKAMLEELQRRNLSPITTRIYLRSIEELARYYQQPPDQFRPEHIRQYQAHLFTERKLGAIAVAQQLSALRFFFLHTLKRPWMLEGMATPKHPFRLPEVLSREEVERLIQGARSPLHRVWLVILYATGMRREELIRLKVSDIDSGRMLIHIRQGKGRKDRDVMLSPRLLEELRDYWRRVQPKPKTYNPTGEMPALNLFPSPGSPNTVVAPGGGLSSVGVDPSDPFRVVQNKTLVGDDFLWNLGTHRITAGASVARVQSSFEQGQYDGGDFTFFTLSNFLLGSANLYFGYAPPTPDYNRSRGFRQVDFLPYIQDDWKVLPKLTLNLGLRWDFTTNPVGSGAPLEAIVNPLTDSGFTVERHAFAQNPNWANFDPRFGLAYDPFADHKTSIRAGFGMFHEQVEARTYALGYISSPPSAFILAEPPLGGIPFPAIPNAPPFYQTQGISYSGTNHAPYAIQYNLTVQREIFAHAVASVGYVGSHGVHLFNQVNENLPIPCSAASAPLPSWCPAMPSGTPGSAGNPYSGGLTNPTFSVVGDAVPMSTSRYNSLEASLNRQFGAVFQVQASYSWSKCIDDDSATYPLENSFGVSDPNDRRLDRGPCAFNRTQNLVLNALYSLPFRRNKLVSGWRLATVITAASGLPVDVADGYDQSLGGGWARPNYSGAAGCHPYEILNQPIAGPAIQYFNPACYTLEPLGTGGNAGRDSIYGPGLFNVDFSVIKRTKITEKLDSEFRAEVFNLFDRANFGLPNPAVFTGPTAGQITTLATPPRQIQFAVRLLF